jgi:MFS family permease
LGVTKLPRNLRILLSAAFVSYLGSGLTFPFLFIYLHLVRGISIGITGLLISGTAVLALVAGPAAGAVIDRFGARVIAVTTLVVEMCATTSLIFVHSAESALLPMVLFGISQASWTAWNALIAVIVDDELRPRVFARNFQLLNLGLGIGALVAGLAVHVSNPGSFVTVYITDAASDLVVIAALLTLPALAFSAVAARSASSAGDSSHPADDSDDSDDSDAARGGYRQVLADRRMIRYIIALVVLGVAGYGAVSAGAVGFATTVLHVSSRTVAWAFAANTAFIVAFQPIGLRVAEGMRRTTAMQTVALFFASSWLVLLLAGAWPSSLVANLLVAVSFVVFAAGEVLLSPVFAPLVNEFAPPELRGRYNALSSVTFSMAAVISPAIAGPMLGASLGREYLILLVGFCGASMLGFAWLRRSLSDEQDHAPAAAPARRSHRMAIQRRNGLGGRWATGAGRTPTARGQSSRRAP